MEVWKDVVGYEGMYQVSNLGRARSVEHVRDNGRMVKAKVIAVTNQTGGYSIVSLRDRSGKKATKYIHQLVLRAFVGERPANHDACHCNGDRGDNRLENLRYDTRANNLADRVKHGTASWKDRNAAWRDQCIRTPISDPALA